MGEADVKNLVTPMAVFTFISHTRTHKITYREQQQQLRRVLQQNGSFDDGVILDTLEKGVIFPVAHFAPSPTSVKKRLVYGKLIKANALGSNYVLHQGIYKEMRTVVPELKFSKRDVPENRGYIFLGFKTLERTFSTMLENTWKDWTGTRFIYLNLHDEFDVSRITFYRRVKPDDLNLFMYIVLVECQNISDTNKIKILDFVQRMRVDRMSGYISVYKELTTDKDSNYHSQDSLNGFLSDISDGPIKVETC